MAVGRAVVVENHTRHHALTVAAGPFVEIGHPIHGTIPFAHAELAYVYRSSFGLTALAGAGPSVALATSSYRTPPPAQFRRPTPSSSSAAVWAVPTRKSCTPATSPRNCGSPSAGSSDAL